MVSMLSDTEQYGHLGYLVSKPSLFLWNDILQILSRDVKGSILISPISL